MKENCVVIAKIDDEVVQFTSDQEVDNFVHSVKNKYEISKVDKTFSTDIQHQVRTKILEEAKELFNVYQKRYVVNGDGDVVYDVSNVNTIGMSEYLRKYGKLAQVLSGENSTLTPNFNEDDWAYDAFEKLKEANIVGNKAEEIIKNTTDSWDQLAEIGEEVHKVFQYAINKKIDLPEMKYLSKSQISDLLDQFEQLKQIITKKHGKVDFLSEIMISSNLNKDIAEKIGKKYLSGRIDMLFITPDGYVHVMDLKVSRKKVGDWNYKENNNNEIWHSTKKLETEYQLAFYKEMLAKKGYKVASVTVVPVKLDLNYIGEKLPISDQLLGKKIESIEDLNIDFANIVGSVSYDYVKQPMRSVNEGGKVQQVVYDILDEKIQRTQVLDLQDMIYNDFGKLFPNSSKSENVKQFEANIDYYIKNKGKYWDTIPPGDEKYDMGYRYVIKNYDFKGESRLYFKTKEDFDKGLSNYVDRVNRNKSSELNGLASQVNESIKAELKTIELTNNNDLDKQVFINSHFSKYIENGWTFMENEDLNRAGLFIFHKNGQCEIYVMSNEPLHNVRKLGLGNSLLGAFKKNIDIDRSKILSASNGNIEIMKVLILIQNNPELFKGLKINTISALNIWQKDWHPSLNSQLLYNFRWLMYENKMSYTLDESLFMDDVNANINLANGFIESVNSKLAIVDWQYKKDEVTVEEAKQKIKKYLSLMTTANPLLYNNKNLNSENVDWRAYIYLYNALLSLDDKSIYNEIDIGNYSDGIMPIGLITTSINYSPSINMRQLGELVTVYSGEVRNRFLSITERWDKIFREFYKSKGTVRAVGGEANYFYDWFVKDSSGKIDKRFVLKNPNGFTNPAEKKAIEVFLEIINELRFNGDKNKIEEAKFSGEYYQVPLMEANLIRQIKNSNDDFFTFMKKYLKEKVNLTENALTSQLEQKETVEKQKQKLYNRFNLDTTQRERLVEEYGVAFFEFDIEKILRYASLRYTEERVSEKYIPIIHGIQLSFAMHMALGGAQMNDIQIAVDKYIKKVIYGESIVEKKLQPVHKVLNELKSATSALTLGANFKSMWREVLQGSFIGFNRAASGILSTQIDFENYLKAYTYVGSEVFKSFNQIHHLEWLIMDAGMTNASSDEIADAVRSNQLGVRNWNSLQLYWTSKAPDFLHRGTMLVAKMYKDGTWNAYDFKDGEKPIYVFERDPRYTQFIKGNIHHPDYNFQKELYLLNLEQFNREGYSIVYDPDQKITPLPKAYTAKEAGSIKNFADLCYGHYDKETRALINSTFLGSFFMQYKTFITAKFEQWMLKPDTYNVKFLKQLVDANGNKLYKVYKWPNENKTGFPTWQIVAEPDLDKNSTYTPYLDWVAQPMEGMIYSVGSFIKALGTMNFEEWCKLWNNDVKRANLLHFLQDFIGMMLLAAAIKFVFKSGEVLSTEKEDQTWLKNWSYAVLYGSTQDGPINNIIQSLAGDLNPPIKSNIERIIRDCGRVIAGEATTWDAFVSNVGAVREWKSIEKWW